MLAVLIVCSKISIPLPLVPLTLQTFAVGLIATLLPVADTFWVIVAYLLLGAIGLPVFAGAGAGIGVLFSAMGGYLFGFIIYGLITSVLLSHKEFSFVNIAVANLIGAGVQLFIGSIWLMHFNSMPLVQALMVGFVPFVVPGIIKVILIMIVARRLSAVVSFSR